jgi:hypothetical protein
MHTFLSRLAGHASNSSIHAIRIQEDSMASVLEGGTIQGSAHLNNPDYTGSDKSPVAAKAADIAQAGKERVKELGGTARERVYETVDGRKSELVRGLHDLTSTLEKASRDIPAGFARQAVDSAVGFLNKTTDRIENETTAELLSDAQERIRERPAVFVAGCVALGFFAGRFLKI